MSFKRKDIEALGIDSDKVQILIDWHSETVKALQSQISELEDKNSKLDEVQSELDKAKSDLKAANEKITAAEKEDYKGKYESEKAAHDKLKEDIATRETKAKKSDAFKAYLKEKGYSETGINKITKYGGYVDGLELDDEGKIKDVEKLLTTVESEWSEYKPVAGVEHHTPPKASTPTGEATTETEAMMKRFAAKYREEHYGVTENDSKED